MKLFTATLIHETNSFSPIPTNLDSYRETFLYLPSTGEGADYADSLVADINITQMARARGMEAHQGLIAGAQPSRPMSDPTWQRLKDEILDGIASIPVLDAIVLFLHGAQMSESVDDCEGGLLEAIRQQVGPEVTIGVSFDLHANVSEKMVEHADLLVSCQEYPHTDFESRTEHLLDLVEQAVKGEIQPQSGFVRIPMFGSFHTTREPMRSFVDRLAALQGRDSVLSISLIHGFAWADVPEAGASLVVYCDRDKGQAQQLAAALADDFFALRDAIVTEPLPVEAALDRALRIKPEDSAGPVVIADTTDNAGGGAPGDSTYLLEAILDRGVPNVALAMLYDPAAVRIAMAAGEGAELNLRLGGKLCTLSGNPLDLRVKVTKVRQDALQLRDTSRRQLGDAVAIETNGVEIVVCSVREQTFSEECFTEMGIDPFSKRLLVVKSHQHFHERFSRFASAILYATPPGVVNRDFSTLPYSHITRPVWPLDTPPFTAFNREWKP